MHLNHQTAHALAALAHLRGLSIEEYLGEIVSREQASLSKPPEELTGSAVINAMQDSPHKDVSLEPFRHRLPVREVRF